MGFQIETDHLYDKKHKKIINLKQGDIVKIDDDTPLVIVDDENIRRDIFVWPGNEVNDKELQSFFSPVSLTLKERLTLSRKRLIYVPTNGHKQGQNK
jgi:hypothetical protein